MVAISLTVLLGMAALAVDLAMLYAARAEAQRAADAAAHAGTIEFWKKPYDPLAVVPVARDSAIQYASRNRILGTSVPTTVLSQNWFSDTLRTEFSGGRVDVIGVEQKVRVTIRRSGIQTFFARVFGVDSAAVAALAAAAVRYADRAECVKPFIVPDFWADYNNDGAVTNKSSNEHYRRFERNPTAWPVETGIGSAYRNGLNPAHQERPRTHCPARGRQPGECSLSLHVLYLGAAGGPVAAPAAVPWRHQWAKHLPSQHLSVQQKQHSPRRNVLHFNRGHRG
jgi:hypothetical protein